MFKGVNFIFIFTFNTGFPSFAKEILGFESRKRFSASPFLKIEDFLIRLLRSKIEGLSCPHIESRSDSVRFTTNDTN